MSVMTENTLAGSGGLRHCANNALMDWIMSPSSGQAIIWRDRKDSNLRPFGYQKLQSPDVSARAFLFIMPPLKVKAAYQSRLKYDAFNPVLQDLHLNLSPFVVNVIV